MYLAERVGGCPTSLRDIAGDEDIPKEYLAKVLRQLADADLVSATRGASGGYQLARNPARISFLDVIEAVEGKVALNACCDAGAGCDKLRGCAMSDVFRKAESAMLDVFRHQTIASVTCAPALRSLLSGSQPAAE